MKPILQQVSIRQVRQSIVLRQMGHFYSDGSRNRYVVENDYRPCRNPLPIMDWCSRIINRKFGTVSTTEDAMWRESDGLV